MCTCAHKGEKEPEIGYKVFAYKMDELLTVSLKDIPEQLILKIHNIIGIYASFFAENIEHCSPITLFRNGKTLRFVLCFSGFMLKIGLHYLFFNMGNMIRLHYGAYIAYSHVFSSCFSKNFSSIFSLGQL